MTGAADQLDAVLTRYPPPVRGARVEPPPAGGGFSGAHVFRAYSADGDYAVRAWPPDTMPTERLRGLHRLLRFLREEGVEQVAAPVRASGGETLVPVGGRLWQVEPWLPGRADFHADPRPERLRAAMRGLALWHRTAARFAPRPEERPWFESRRAAPSPAVAERLSLLGEWRRGKLHLLQGQIHARPLGELDDLVGRFLRAFERLSGDVEGQLRTAAALRFDLQPCLRDVWHDHVLFTGDEVTGLIDPSACRAENVAADLARLVGSLVGDDAALWSVALDEYQAHRPLTPDEIGLVVTLDRGGVLLSGMTWLDRLWLQRQSIPDTDAVTRRLRRIVERLDHLAPPSGIA